MRKPFEEIFEDQTKRGTKIQTNEYYESGAHIIIDQGQSQIAGYTDREEGIFSAVPVIIFGDHTRIIKYVDEPFFLGADGVKVLRCKLPEANYRYLYYALQNAKIPNTGYNRHFKWLKEVQIAYPDVKQQEEIVATLDCVSRVIADRRGQLFLLDSLIRTRFIEMFGDPHRSKSYPYVAISELTDIVSGGTPDRRKVDYWKNGTIPWVKTTELKNTVIMDVEEYITEKGLAESSAKIVPANSVLIAMYGQGKTRGMTGYLAITACTNQACACLLPTDKMDMQYLWHYLILSYDELRGLAQGGNQPNLNAGMIKAFPILVPPVEKQRQFSTFVSQIDKSKAIVQKALEKAQILFNSLMQEYFG